MLLPRRTGFTNFFGARVFGSRLTVPPTASKKLAVEKLEKFIHDHDAMSSEQAAEFVPPPLLITSVRE
jgi:hypothetical protein